MDGAGGIGGGDDLAVFDEDAFDVGGLAAEGDDAVAVGESAADDVDAFDGGAVDVLVGGGAAGVGAYGGRAARARRAGAVSADGA